MLFFDHTGDLARDVLGQLNGVIGGCGDVQRIVPRSRLILFDRLDCGPQIDAAGPVAVKRPVVRFGAAQTIHTVERDVHGGQDRGR